MAFKEQLMGLLRSGAAMTAAGSILTTGGYVIYKDQTRYRKMERTFAHGNILAPLAENEHEVKYYRRPDVESDLELALSSRFTNEYYLVTGEVGSGKTRTIVEMVRRKMTEASGEGDGAPIYVLASQGKYFAESLARAVNFHFDEHISFQFFIDVLLRVHSLPERDEGHKLLRVLDAIENAAFGYMQRTGRPAVLVIDGVNSMAGERRLAILQEKAKLWADTNIVKVVFVSNDERTEELLQRHQSNWSRAASPIYVGDLTEQQAVQFLSDPQLLESDPDGSAAEPISEREAVRMYELVGGRIQHLIAFKRDRRLGLAFERTADQLRGKEREKFLEVSKSSSVLRLLGLVLQSRGDGVPLHRLIDAGSRKDVADLLRCNLIRIERTGRGIVAVFQSRLTENVAATLLSNHN